MAKKVVRQIIRHGKRHENLSKVLKMSRARHANPSYKARQSRMYRKSQKEQKRFEAPLREFIETKYKNIFQEYVVLFNQMDSQNPDKINLKKTEIFKQWKIANEQKSTDILSVAIEETIGQNYVEVNQSGGNDNEDIQSEQSEGNASEAEQSEGNASEAEQSEGNASEEEDEGLLAAQQVDDLVNQMINDDELRALLNVEEPEADEGIELNLFDEIDIEPFDYRLEVELGDW